MPKGPKCLTLGIMGLISPCGTGPSPVYADSGFLLGADYIGVWAQCSVATIFWFSCWSACRSCFF